MSEERERTNRVNHLSMRDAKAEARAAGAVSIDTVGSYLTLCHNTADVDNTLAALRRNQPHLFRRADKDLATYTADVSAERSRRHERTEYRRCPVGDKD